MTYSQRFRLVRSVKFIFSHWLTPFILGWFLSFVSTSSSLIEALNSIDKSALSICALPFSSNEAAK